MKICLLSTAKMQEFFLFFRLALLECVQNSDPNYCLCPEFYFTAPDLSSIILPGGFCRKEVKNNILDIKLFLDPIFT